MLVLDDFEPKYRTNELIDNINKLNNMISQAFNLNYDEKIYMPLQYFGAGCSKMTYELSEDYIIKFFLDDCDYYTEKELYDASLELFTEENNILVPSKFYSIANNILLEIYDDNRGYTLIFNKFVIQRKCELIDEDEANNIQEVFDEYYCEDSSFVIDNWIENVVDLEQVRNFIYDYNLHDLHGNNIGYLDGRAIIFDWFSEI